MDKTCNVYDLLAKKSTINLWYLYSKIFFNIKTKFKIWSGHSGIVSNCAFTTDERIIATSSWDKTLLIWDIATGSYRKNGPSALMKGYFKKKGHLLSL